MRRAKIASVATIAALVAAGAATAEADTPNSTNPGVTITSGAPVPGAFTAGKWTIANYNGPDAIPAGTVFTVKFSGLVTGQTNIGATTVTSPAWNGLAVKRVSNDTYTITVTREIGSGFELSGAWSMADTIFNPRAKVEISVTSLGQGATDVDLSNNTAMYNNSGKGF